MGRINSIGFDCLVVRSFSLHCLVQVKILSLQSKSHIYAYNKNFTPIEKRKCQKPIWTSHIILKVKKKHKPQYNLQPILGVKTLFLIISAHDMEFRRPPHSCCFAAHRLRRGLKVTGKHILAQLYNNHNVNAWGMIGVLLAYIALFRLVHYGLFLYASLPFLSAADSSSSTAANRGGGSRSGGRNGNVADSEKYLAIQQLQQPATSSGSGGDVELV